MLAWKDTVIRLASQLIIRVSDRPDAIMCSRRCGLAGRSLAARSSTPRSLRSHRGRGQRASSVDENVRWVLRAAALRAPANCTPNTCLPGCCSPTRPRGTRTETGGWPVRRARPLYSTPDLGPLRHRGALFTRPTPLHPPSLFFSFLLALLEYFAALSAHPSTVTPTARPMQA